MISTIAARTVCIVCLIGSAAAANARIGYGAVLDNRPMGTAELVLMCAGLTNFGMNEATQKIACLHYVQGFLDAHIVTIGYLKEFQERGDRSVQLPKSILTCINPDNVSASSLLAQFGKRYGNPDAVAKTPNAYTALMTILLDNYSCK
jgi:hypothetical protein